MFSEVHFHWGKKTGEGSESLVDGCSYSAEMHAVFWKKEYGSKKEALKYRDGLALVAYFLEVKDENPALQRLLDKIEDVIVPNNPVQISPFMLEKLTPPFRRKYVTYEGSMSIPPCLQVVTWFVRLKPLHISLEQLKQFRLLEYEDGKPITMNFRPTQPLHGRIVSYKD
ncbi:carbonic anhydrase 7-like [Hetaerina americana]|uniref:carbonic anhydrase 7-like n=1 Tax=Hetaerina americana TaxID=62018 RepID=UPI003A7F1002